MGRLQPSGSVLSAFLPPILLSLALSSSLSGQVTFTVNVTNDLDDGTCDGIHCSLREAINAANQAAGGGVIAFNIPGPAPHTVRPTSSLPLLLGGVTLDGTTAPDFAGTPVIELDGSLAGGFAQGLNVAGSGNLIRGLVVNRFSDVGISIGSGAEGTVVEGCFVGTDVTGTVALGNGNIGILIGQATDNTLGGPTAAARNLVSGNPEGITVLDVTATGNLIQGNYIGTDVTGTVALPNTVGVLLLAPGNVVGGSSAGEGNLISGNTGHGVSLGPPNAVGNTVLGNLIGVDVTGAEALGNDIGVWVDNVADNLIGGTTAGARNVISGNREGITLWEEGATGNRIQGNYVGTNGTGDSAIPNGMGIPIYSPGNTVGGTEAGAGNLISGNETTGVNLYGENASGNVVQGNLIGTDASGSLALGNGESGVAVVFAAANVVGGLESGAGNVISGNVIAGITLFGPETQDNRIQGNLIGTDQSGTTALGNGESGVALHNAASGNTIGGTDPGARNVLSGNTFGILLGDLAAEGNRIQGNYIGTNASGDAPIPNTQTGILLWGENTLIGGSETGSGNVISGNVFAGIDLGPGSTGTVIQGNYIGTDATGGFALGNDLGIFVNFSPDNLIGGTSIEARNVISGNVGRNITINGLDATGNVLQGNFIGTDATGTVPLESGRALLILDAPGNTVGGTQSGAGNVISGTQLGVSIEGPAATGNLLQGNHLGVDVTGSAPLGNRGATIRFTNGASGNTVGGTQEGAGNIIANSSWVGVGVFPDAGTGNRILGNAIFDNGGLGIELNRDGVNTNDEGDVDIGPNNLQNYPEIASAVASGGGAIHATLSSAPSATFTLEFFADTVCDETGFGEGRFPLGTASLSTDASGIGSVTAAFSGIPGTLVTATATDADGSTSEFSQCAGLTTLAVAPSPASRTVTAGQAATYTITAAAQGGTFEGTLALSCSGNPSGTTCTFDDDQVTLDAGQASVTMTVTTVAPAGSGPWFPKRIPPFPPAVGWVLLLTVIGIAVAGVGRARWEWHGGGRIPRRVRMGFGAAFIALLFLTPISCGDDGNRPPSGGTPAGTYEITVTAAWESVQISTTVTMVVQ